MAFPAHLLVTTSQSLLLLNPCDGTAYRLDTGREHYYGIARDVHHYYVGVRCRANTSQVPKAEERGKILRFDKSMQATDMLEPDFAMRDIHQVLVHDGKLWVTCSFDNMVAVYDGLSWSAWYPLGRPVVEPFDVNHFNSLTGFGNELAVVAHNLYAVSGRGSEIHFFSLPDLQWLRSVPLGIHSHNAWWHNGELMTCSSYEGRLLGERGFSVPTSGFPRGLAASDDAYFVGISEFAARSDRDLGNGWIKVFDKTWGARQTVTIREEGMVTDIMTITGPEAAHILDAQDRPAIRYVVSEG
ncbi:conserved hypothetical protein [Burkholderia cenocepacia]|uniref:hypothetical protein n=1 Tax=Burkholderia cenocepacia TaxID=95486 RepID=UPI00192BF749|nr:hypothetical protein [Burkholderia cenocepacia]CAD9218334.1 conserved hypothetical protein [Burkholderia cenocepacia]